MNYKYCPKCAGELELKQIDHASHPTCRSCGFVFFQNSKPCSSPLITNDSDQVLLIKRNIKPHLGKWDIPGGFLENGEDPIEGLKREAMEELGVEIEPGELILVCIDNYPTNDGDFFTLNLFYKAKALSQNIILDGENSQWEWFSEQEIPWGDLAFSNTELSLKKLYGME